jgi:hypothetical protein
VSASNGVGLLCGLLDSDEYFFEGQNGLIAALLCHVQCTGPRFHQKRWTTWTRRNVLFIKVGRGVYYKFLNIGHQNANEWILKGISVLLNSILFYFIFFLNND